MPTFSFGAFPSSELQFSMENHDLSHLEIRSAGQGSSFYYFYDNARRQLVSDFVLEDRPRVRLLCQVTLIRKDDKYSPRLRFWKQDKTKSGRRIEETEVAETLSTRTIKSSVDTDGGHDNLWRLIAFLQAFNDIEVPREAFRVVDGDSAQLAAVLQSQDKPTVLEAIRTAIGNELTEQDIAMIANRKQQLARFEQLVEDREFFEAERERMEHDPEELWQDFFENNQWIFGYGLNLISVKGMDEGKLERITTGADIFEGGGKRVDALMRTRGYISSLLLCEIKTHRTDLLVNTPYRPPDVFRPSKELAGGVVQIQKTVRKALRKLSEKIETLTEPDGTPTAIEFGTSRPRQVVLIGSLTEFEEEFGRNAEKYESFELFRTSVLDTEIITFDELLERARFIVHG
jgi:Domain of unknown function (DUF4263)